MERDFKLASSPLSLFARHNVNTSACVKNQDQNGNSPQHQLRMTINFRERCRMHDLNEALDELRNAIPYAHGSSVRKLSKIATLLLAKNHIIMQANVIRELQQTIVELQNAAQIVQNKNNNLEH